MQRILHATMDGVHLYKFVGMRIDDISKLRFNGRPIDIDFLPRRPAHMTASSGSMSPWSRSLW